MQQLVDREPVFGQEGAATGICWFCPLACNEHPHQHQPLCVKQSGSGSRTSSRRAIRQVANRTCFICLGRCCCADSEESLASEDLEGEIEDVEVDAAAIAGGQRAR